MSLRDGPLGDVRPSILRVAVLAFVVAVGLALALFLAARRTPGALPAYPPARQAADRLVAPVGGVLAVPFRWLTQGVQVVEDYVGAGGQNADLRRRLANALSWRDEALLLRSDNARLRALMGIRTDPPLPVVYGRAVLDSRGPMANSLLLDAGSSVGVVEGNPVLSEHGLVGRVVGVAPQASRVMLLTDLESRTPVLIGRTNGRAILAGDGGSDPELTYLRTHTPLREGDRILTSGDGGVLPRGLPVGAAARGTDGIWHVALDSDAAPIDFVQILLFRDFAQIEPPAALASRDLPSSATEPPLATAPPTPPKSPRKSASTPPKPSR